MQEYKYQMDTMYEMWNICIVDPVPLVCWGQFTMRKVYPYKHFLFIVLSCVFPNDQALSSLITLFKRGSLMMDVVQKRLEPKCLCIGGTEKGTWGAQFEILRPLFNTNTPLKPPFRHFGNHFGPQKSDFWPFCTFWWILVFFTGGGYIFWESVWFSTAIPPR